jgi:hypothetical protein
MIQGGIMNRTLFFFTFSAYAAANPVPAGFLSRPLAFEPNRGQAAPTVRFVAHGNSRDYLLSPSGVTSGASLRFSGANAEPQALALDPLAERHNYFRGRVSQTDIPTYRRVRYSRVYPGIDCVFYGDQKGLKFDFEVSPGADPNKIRLCWQNANQVRLDANGELVIETSSGELHQRKPSIYQERNGRRISVDGGRCPSRTASHPRFGEFPNQRYERPLVGSERKTKNRHRRSVALQANRDQCSLQTTLRALHESKQFPYGQNTRSIALIEFLPSTGRCV